MKAERKSRNKRNNPKDARLLPSPDTMTATETFADIYGCLQQNAGIDWLANSLLENSFPGDIRNPWES